MITHSVTPPRSLRLCILGLFVLAACTSSERAETVVIVTVSADPAVPAVTRIHALMSVGGRSAVHDYPKVDTGERIKFSTTFGIIVPLSYQGTLGLALDGLDAKRAVVASGTASVALKVGARNDVTVHLAPGVSPCGNGKLDPDEECDDRNRVSGDGCDVTCKKERLPDAGADGPRDVAGDLQLDSPLGGGGGSGGTGGTGGSAWSSVSSGTTKSLSDVWGSGQDDVWAVGSGGTIPRWNGSTWSSVSSGTTKSLSGVWGSGPNDVWAVGDDGTILRWNGSSWLKVSSGTTNYPYLCGVWGSGPNDVWAVGSVGTILRWNGSVWSGVESGTTQDLLDVWGSGPDDVWVIGDGGTSDGTILRWNGSSWLKVSSGTTNYPYLCGVWGSGPSDVWAVGTYGTILRWNGSSWLKVPSGKMQSLYSVWGSGSSDVWAVGTNGIILHYK